MGREKGREEKGSDQSGVRVEAEVNKGTYTGLFSSFLVMVTYSVLVSTRIEEKEQYQQVKRRDQMKEASKGSPSFVSPDFVTVCVFHSVTVTFSGRPPPPCCLLVTMGEAESVEP